MLETIAAFLPICIVTSFVCCAVGESEPRVILRKTMRFLTSLILGIAAFCGVVELLSLVP